MIEIFRGLLVGAIFVVTAGALFFGVYTLVEICRELVAVWEDFRRNRM